MPISVGSIGTRPPLVAPTLETPELPSGFPSDPTIDPDRVVDRLFNARRDLVSSNIDLLNTEGPGAIQNLRSASPELGAAAQAAQGVLSGQSVGQDFGAAIADAARMRGLDPSELSPESGFLDTFTDQFLPQATGVATRTGFEDLFFAGFQPPSGLGLGQFGDLSVRRAELAAQTEANLAQTRLAQQMFNFQFQNTFGRRTLF